MGDATVNGDLPHSATLDHVKNYHFVHDGVDAFLNNPYGQKSVDLTNAIYSRLVKPAFPYLETPASYVKPYAIKVDEYGDLFLTKVDERYPVLKSETKEIQGTIIGYIHLPVEKADEVRAWVLSTYKDEYKKCGGDGYVAGGKAVITSSLLFTSVILNWISERLAVAKEEGKEAAKKAEEKVSQ